MMCFLFLAHKSLAILRYELTLAVDIERGYASKSGAGGRRVCVFVLEISRNGEFETYEFERFGGWFDGDVFMLLVSSAPNLS